MLMDSHAHIQTRQFDKDRDAVIQAAFDAGVERILVPGIEVETSRLAVATGGALSWPHLRGGRRPSPRRDRVHPRCARDAAATGESAGRRRDWRDRPGLLSQPLAT